ncbi:MULTISPECIES: helix-turn-helix domain-containing protein [unclassified Streptomyces]|uniref:helix-turn-helix domain-containing protein n=1 Tax=unclassified Streptomyces TaxID=2593676 RepID=UPI00093C2A96|nr:helix-turn-helix domain-containing protein [Streptomyces sp. CB02058]OKI92426.1 ArsR family transcriptional regulator [Streptomyces sp. CB02058]
MDNDATHRVLDPEQDPAALKALTHPLRLKLLGLLRLHGPATASELAARTGESSASTSYHLRVLAKYAFVAEAEHRDGRERRWKAVHSVTSTDNAAMLATPAGRAMTVLGRRRQIEHLLQTVDRHEADIEAGRLGEEWHDPSGIDDLMPLLTPESLRELRDTIGAKLAELTARDEHDPRAERVVLLTAGLPLATDGRRAPAGGKGPADRSASAGDEASAGDGALGGDGPSADRGASAGDEAPGTGNAA